jgi:hypothetical protein
MQISMDPRKLKNSVEAMPFRSSLNPEQIDSTGD